MEYEQENIITRISIKERVIPRGNYIEGFDINPAELHYRFNVNPNKHNNSYVVTQIQKRNVKGWSMMMETIKHCLNTGFALTRNENNPSYPLMAWDPKGPHHRYLRTKEGLNYLWQCSDQDQTIQDRSYGHFRPVQDVKYMLDSRTLLYRQ